jgi:hypothetical protein
MMKTEKEKKAEARRYLQRRGWMDTSLFIKGGVEYEPQEDEIEEILALFFAHHRDEHMLMPTAMGGRLISDEKVFAVFYKPLGWEFDEREYYDTISRDVTGYHMKELMKFFREVGPNFSPDEETFEKLLIVNNLCDRYGTLYIHTVPIDDREYFEWYVRIATARVPRIEERFFRNNQIAEYCSFSVIKDLFRLAYLMNKDDMILQEWERQRSLPPERYHDELFLEFYKKLGMHGMVEKILNDLWQRGENWSLFRLIDRLKKGFVMGRKGMKPIPLIEARLLSLGERVMGEWNRVEIEKILALSREPFPGDLFGEHGSVPREAS